MTIAERFLTMIAVVAAVPTWLVAATAWHTFTLDVRNTPNDCARSLLVACAWTLGLCIPVSWVVAWWLS